MSDKIILEKTMQSITSAIDVLSRDSLEISLLQSSAKNMSNFTFASYRRVIYILMQELSNCFENNLLNFIFPEEDYFFHRNQFLTFKVKDILLTEGSKKYKETLEKIQEDFKISNSECFWMLPVSNPIEFCRGSRQFAFSIALSGKPSYYNDEGFQSNADNNKYYQAIGYDFSSNNYYTATVGEGAYFYNTYNTKLKNSEIPKLRLANVAIVGIEKTVKLNPELIKDDTYRKFITKIKNLSFNIGNLSCVNCPTLALLHISSGKLDGLVYIGKIDFSAIIAGAIIALESGSAIYSLKGEEISLENISKATENGFIAGNKIIAKKLSDKINEAV